MKRLSASEARQNWFRVLDEVLAGEVVVIERKGRRVVLRVEAAPEAGADAALPEYAALIQGEVGEADRWSWEWSAPEGEVTPLPPLPPESSCPE